MSLSNTGTLVARIAGVAAVAGLAVISLGTPASSLAASRVRPQASHAALSRAKVYVIVSLAPGSPNTLQVRLPGTSDPAVTVTLSPSAKVVRRYDGKSSFSELNVNDRVSIWPAGAAAAPSSTAGAPATTGTTPAAGTPVPATLIKDFSIQVADTQIAGLVTNIQPNALTVKITAAKNPNVAAFTVGQSITVDITSTTTLMAGKTSEPVSSLVPNVSIIRAWGLSDGANGVMLAPRAIHVVPQSAAGQTDATTTSDN